MVAPKLGQLRSHSCDDVLRGRTNTQDDEDASADEAVMADASTIPAQAGRGHHIQVAVRCRPLHPQEAREGLRPIVKVSDSQTVVLEDPQITAADDYLRINKSKERRYVFDEAFHEGAGTRQVYERTARLLIGGVLQGFNATVFAYGATGAGKTHTMLGNPSEPGIMMLTLQDLFNEVAQQKEERIFEVKCSFLEVYNENIRDLLIPDGDYLDIREDPVKGMCVAGISEVGGLESAKEIMTLLHQANKNRSTEATGANVTSSRSHAVLQVVVEQRDRTADIVAQVNVGKLSMIDLAGSERASQTNNKGMRMIEGANINRSLLALGNCITALSSAVAFVPYRDSKMTRLLKDSLGGNCRTAMIANVSPSHLNYEDTHNTLKYAKRASNIKTKAVRNVVRVNSHVSKYSEIIKELRNEISDLKLRLAEAALVVTPVPSSTAGEADAEASPTPETAVEVEQSTKWKQELMQNFEERVRLKRQLIDCAQQAQAQLVQKSEAQVEISQWESAQVQGDPSGREAPEHIRSLQEKLQFLKASIATTEETTHDLERKLVDNQQKAEKLQAELPSRVQNQDMRSFLGLVSRIYVMEVENMDMQEMNDVMAPLLQQKDLEAEALRLQIQMRDRMIEEQDQLLLNEGVDLLPRPETWVNISSKVPRYITSPLVDEVFEDYRGGASSGEESAPVPRGLGRVVNRGMRVGQLGGPRSLSQPPEGRGTVVLPPLSPNSNRGRHMLHEALDGAAAERPQRRRGQGLSPLRGGTPPALLGAHVGGSSSSKAPAPGVPTPHARELHRGFGGTPSPSDVHEAGRALDVAGRGLGQPSTAARMSPVDGHPPGDLTNVPPRTPPGQAPGRLTPTGQAPKNLDVAGRGIGGGGGAAIVSPNAGSSGGSRGGSFSSGAPPSREAADATTAPPQHRDQRDNNWREGDLDNTMLPVVQGVHAVADRRHQPRQSDGTSSGAAAVAHGGRQQAAADGRARPLGAAAAYGQRRGRKKNRRTDAAARVMHEKDLQQVHLEVAGVHREVRGDTPASGSDSEPPAAAPTHSIATAAERKGILQKLNSKAKPPSAGAGEPPKSLH